EKNQRLLCQQELEEEGYEVALAADGIEALESVERSRPDAIILDMCMPRMDGIETLSQVVGRDSSIPVIIHSAYSSYQDNFMTWSADAYVVKSADLSELKTRLREVLEGREAGQPE
ncbi:MAG: response regulator, partial [Planctomycetota bacterium]